MLAQAGPACKAAGIRALSLTHASIHTRLACARPREPRPWAAPLHYLWLLGRVAGVGSPGLPVTRLAGVFVHYHLRAGQGKRAGLWRGKPGASPDEGRVALTPGRSVCR